ncbi:MAG: hypothetical protein ABT940_09680 [Alphaproteobacteria bacterium]
MVRIATAASQQLMVNRILTMQQQMDDLQVQTSTQEVSQDFTGIATQSLNLMGFQNQSKAAQGFIDNNNLAIQQLRAQTTVANNIQKSVSDMRSALLNFADVNLSIKSTDNTLAINGIQNLAFNTMKDMAGQLNSKFVGGYLFAGGKVDTQPVNFSFKSVAEFQAKYPGTGANYPNTRAAQLGSTTIGTSNPPTTSPSVLSFNSNGTITASRLDSSQYGTLSFTAAAGTVTAGTAGAFAGLAVGTQFTVTGSTGNNQTYTISANDGTILTVTPPPAVDEPAVATGSMNFGVGPALYGDLTFDPSHGQISAKNLDSFAGLAIGATFTMSGAANAGNNQVYTVTANDGKTLTVSPPPGAVENQTTTGLLTPNVFENLPIGAKITVAGSGVVGNNQTYTVTGNTGSVLTVVPRPTTTMNTTSAATTLFAEQPNSYYAGDQLQAEHRIDPERSITLGINASDPGFEKAFRALSIITQGDLQNHPSRVQQAIDLLSDALDHNKHRLPNEASGGIIAIQQVLGRDAVLLDDANTQQTNFKGFLDQRASGILHIDPAVTVTKLNLTTTALEIAMKAMAQVSKLSLSNYI